MKPSSIHHLALTSNDLTRAKVFYGDLLNLLGYHLHVDNATVLAWSGPDPEILIYSAKEEQKNKVHQLYDPGIHHIAFQATSRSTVNAACEVAERCGGVVLDRPKLFTQYSDDYYATFFLDPDGIKLEVMTTGK